MDISEDILSKLSDKSYLDSLEDNEYFITVINKLIHSINVYLKIGDDQPLVQNEHFVNKLTTFLSKINSPISIDDNLLKDVLLKRKLIEYLLNELLAAKISLKQSQKYAETGNLFKKVSNALDFHDLPGSPNFFNAFYDKLRNYLPKTKGANLLGNTFFHFDQYTLEDWNDLQNFVTECRKNFEMRKELLITRFDVTIETFGWSKKDERVNQKYANFRQHFDTSINLNISDLLAMTKDMLVLTKTSDKASRKFTQTALNRILIGQVSDRGGRPDTGYVHHEEPTHHMGARNGPRPQQHTVRHSNMMHNPHQNNQYQMHAPMFRQPPAMYRPETVQNQSQANNFHPYGGRRVQSGYNTNANSNNVRMNRYR